jgi:cold shock CspA family protein
MNLKNQGGHNLEGIIKSFNVDRGYGFIIARIKDNKKEEIFFHKRNVFDDLSKLESGVRVVFNVVETNRGLNAVNVVRTDVDYVKESKKYIEKWWL